MHIYEVGQPYNGTRKTWPQGAQFNYRGGETELLLFFDSPDRHEVAAVQSGPAEFGLYTEPDQILLTYRFGPAKGHRGDIPWGEAPYTFHRRKGADRVLPPPLDRLNTESRAILFVILIEAAGGLIRAQRQVSLSAEFTRALFAAIHEQAERPWDQTAYDRRLNTILAQYSSDKIAAACRVHSKGGS